MFESTSPPETVLALTNEGALLVLIPQYDRKWVLKRLAGWNKPFPREETSRFAMSSAILTNQSARILPFHQPMTLSSFASLLIGGKGPK
jgi:hypothetical protein